MSPLNYLQLDVVKTAKKKKKKKIHGSNILQTEYAEFGHFMLLFCRRRPVASGQWPAGKDITSNYTQGKYNWFRLLTVPFVW